MHSRVVVFLPVLPAFGSCKVLPLAWMLCLTSPCLSNIRVFFSFVKYAAQLPVDPSTLSIGHLPQTLDNRHCVNTLHDCGHNDVVKVNG